MSSRRRFTSLALLVAMLAAVGACGVHSRNNGSKFTYAALGDSYVSGAVGQPTGPCGRSKGSYPNLIQHQLHASTFRDASCGGATTTNVLSSAPINGTQTDAQIDAVPRDANLVTVGIGADDGNLYPAIFIACFLEASKRPAACSAALAAAPQILATTQPAVASVLEAIHTRAPQAQVLLVGYLRLVPDSGPCPALHITQAQSEAFATIESDVEAMLASTAKQAGVTFVPMHAKSAGHDACSDNSWTNALTSKRGDGIFLHPRAAGMRAVAAAVDPLISRP